MGEKEMILLGEVVKAAKALGQSMVKNGRLDSLAVVVDLGNGHEATLNIVIDSDEETDDE